MKTKVNRSHIETLTCPPDRAATRHIIHSLAGWGQTGIMRIFYTNRN